MQPRMEKKYKNKKWTKNEKKKSSAHTLYAIRDELWSTSCYILHTMQISVPYTAYYMLQFTLILFRILCNGHVRRLHMDSYIKSIVLSSPLFYLFSLFLILFFVSVHCFGYLSAYPVAIIDKKKKRLNSLAFTMYQAMMKSNTEIYSHIIGYARCGFDSFFVVF